MPCSYITDGIPSNSSCGTRSSILTQETLAQLASAIRWCAVQVKTKAADLSAVLLERSHELLLSAQKHSALLFLQLHAPLETPSHHSQLLCSILTGRKLTLQSNPDFEHSELIVLIRKGTRTNMTLDPAIKPRL